jgi:AcrR family transcriptional regulator
MRAVASTRDALIAAAAGLLEEGGVAAVTLREVGRRAGVSHNAPYKHFADKEDLLAAVAAVDLRRREASTRRARSTRTAADAVKAMLHGYVRHARQHPELFRLVYGPWKAGSPELASAADAARSSFVDAVAQAQHDGDFPDGDPERLTALLLALAHGAAELALSGHLARDGKGHADPTDLVDDFFAYFEGAQQGT